MFAASRVSGEERSWEDIEAELLSGQKLQGTLTAMQSHPAIHAVAHQRTDGEWLAQGRLRCSRQTRGAA